MTTLDVNAVIERLVPTTQPRKWLESTDDQLELLDACIRGTIRNMRLAGAPLLQKTVEAAAWQWFTLLAIHNQPRERAEQLTKKHLRALKDGKVYLHEAIRPRYEVASYTTEEARAVLTGACADFVAKQKECPEVGIRVTTGVGKTRGIARAIAEDRKAIVSALPWVYFVPTHRLGYELEDLFAEHGVKARLFKGRDAFVGREKNGPRMCERPEQVKAAVDSGLSVETTCCKFKDDHGYYTRTTCEFYRTCAYQAQQLEQPDVWICAHSHLFKSPKGVDKARGIIIDESFIDKGIDEGTSVHLTDLLADTNAPTAKPVNAG